MHSKIDVPCTYQYEKTVTVPEFSVGVSRRESAHYLHPNLAGTRLHEEDVAALLASQAALQRLVPGFRFNLGFSAKYFHRGTAAENRGDDQLLKHREHFNW